MIKEWWKEIRIEGWEGFKLAAKLKVLKSKIKEWAKNHFGDVEKMKETILGEILALDKTEEEIRLSPSDQNRRLVLKEEYQRKVREEETRWKQRSKCQWLNYSDENTKFSHGVASTRSSINRICSFVDGDVRLENREDIINHIT